jgi:hypothetical protein
VPSPDSGVKVDVQVSFWVEQNQLLGTVVETVYATPGLRAPKL